MPTLIPEMYECDVCGRRYSNISDAFECEDKPFISYPIGCIYADHQKDSLYYNITFAVAENVRVYHANYGSSWACRDNQYGDSLDEYLCGGCNILKLNDGWANIDVNHPTFIRMVTWLKEKNIPITVWDGVKAVPYDEYISYTMLARENPI